jgi:hypothetical protein
MFDDNKGEIHEFFKDRDLTDGKYILSEEDFNTYLEGMGSQVDDENFKPQYIGIPVEKQRDGNN